MLKVMRHSLTFLLLLLLLFVTTDAPGTEVSTTTSGCTTISCDEYCVGSSVIVLRDRSEGILGYTRPLLTVRTGRSGFGDGSGVGRGIRSTSASNGMTSAGGPIMDKSTGSSTNPFNRPKTINRESTTKKYLKNTNKSAIRLLCCKTNKITDG